MLVEISHVIKVGFPRPSPFLSRVPKIFRALSTLQVLNVQHILYIGGATGTAGIAVPHFGTNPCVSSRGFVPKRTRFGRKSQIF